MIGLSKILSDYSVPEADGVKYSKIEMTLPASGGVQTLGTGPKFKRKKSFWRAIRRGEVWALLPLYRHNMINALAAELYGGVIPPQNFLTDKYIPSDVMYLLRKNNE